MRAGADGFCGVFTPQRPQSDVRSACPANQACASVVACHGEIDNLSELRRQLGVPDGAPLDRLLNAGWHRWSIGLVQQVEGVIALALNDGDQLALYRDQSGLRSLYWWPVNDGRVVYATELNLVAREAEARPSIARSSIHEYLRFLDIATPNTIYKDFRSVEPGQMLLWPRGGPEVKRVASTTPSASTPTDFDRAVDHLGELLGRAVNGQLTDASSPAAFLSGGIDSALISAIAVRQRTDIHAVTVGFGDERFDESPTARRIAAHLGVRHQVLRFDRKEYLCAFERLSQLMDQPMADPATMATVLAFDHCKEHFDGVLDGTGADEAVGAMPPRHVRLAVGYASLLPAAVRRLLIRALSSVPGLARYRPILDFEHPADTMIRWRGFTRLEIEELCGEPVSFEHTQFYRTFARFPRHAHYERYSALLNAMPCDRLTEATLVSGMTVRYPFCSREVDGYLRQLPTEWRHLPGQPKRILRALLARYVPREIWDVPKHSFDFPLHNFLAGEDFALVRRYAVNGAWLDRGLLRPDVVRRHARQYIEGDRGKMFRVWALVVLGAWLEKHEYLT